MSPASLLRPPLLFLSILILHKKLTRTDQLWFIQAGDSYCRVVIKSRGPGIFPGY